MSLNIAFAADNEPLEFEYIILLLAHLPNMRLEAHIPCNNGGIASNNVSLLTEITSKLIVWSWHIAIRQMVKAVGDSIQKPDFFLLNGIHNGDAAATTHRVRYSRMKLIFDGNFGMNKVCFKEAGTIFIDVFPTSRVAQVFEMQPGMAHAERVKIISFSRR